MFMYTYIETYINIILHKHTFLQKRYIYIYLYLPNTMCVFRHTHIQREVKQNRDYARKKSWQLKKKRVFITSCVGYQK